jgi:hypothetical protein
MDIATEPLVRYGEVTKGLPGDPDGWKLRDCGNIAHWFDQERLRVSQEGPQLLHNDLLSLARTFRLVSTPEWGS